MKNATLATFGILTLLVIALLFFDSPPNPIDIYALENSADQTGNVITPRSATGETIENLLSGENRDVPPDNVIDSQNNLTQKAAKSIADAILADESLLDGNADTAEKFAAQILESGLAIGENEFNPIIRDSDLKTIANPTAKDHDSYDQELAVLVKKYLSLPRGSFGEVNQTAFEKARNEIRKITVSAYNLPVPQNLLFFHKEFIRLLSIQEEALGNLAAFERDPLKAVTSVKVLEASHTEIMKILNSLISQAS